MRRTMTVTMAVAALTWAAAPVWAHVELTTAEAAAGSTTELEFELGHGCDGSPVVAVSIQIPEGVTDVTPGEREGWTSSVGTADGLEFVTWEGGPQPDEEHGHFHMTVTLPDAEGEVLAFPAVQTCEEGEVAWIELPNADGSEPENPAPLLTLIAGDSSAAPATTEADEEDPDQADTTLAPTTTVAITETTAAPTTTVATEGTTGTTATTVTVVAEPEEESGGNAGLFAGLAVGLAVVGGGLGYMVRKRKPA